MKKLVISTLILMSEALWAAPAPKIIEVPAQGLIPQPATTCDILGEGDAIGQWKKFRVSVRDHVVEGADSLRELGSKVRTLQASGVCRLDKASMCDLDSEGVVAGAWVKHRLIMNDEAILGANDLGSLLTQMSELRQEGFCQ